MMIDLTAFVSPAKESSVFKGLPMTMYTPEVRAALRTLVKKTTGKGMQIKFRGPRNTMVDLLCRSKYTRQSNCAKFAATSFAVYPYERNEGRSWGR